MVGARADVALAACADHITRAILIRAQERSAAMHAFRHAGLIGIVRRGGALRIASYASRRRELRVVVGSIPVANPFPDVAADVVKAVAVRGKLSDGRYTREAVRARIVVRKMTLVRVGH